MYTTGSKLNAVEYAIHHVHPLLGFLSSDKPYLLPARHQRLTIISSTDGTNNIIKRTILKLCIGYYPRMANDNISSIN